MKNDKKVKVGSFVRVQGEGGLFGFGIVTRRIKGSDLYGVLCRKLVSGGGELVSLKVTSKHLQPNNLLV